MTLAKLSKKALPIGTNCETKPQTESNTSAKSTFVTFSVRGSPTL